MEERIQKIIANAGIASRRMAEQMISEGRVTLNGQIVTELGQKANPNSDHIKVDGKLIPQGKHYVYYLINKPKGFISAVQDEEGKPVVTELLKPKVKERVYPVGRLDMNSEGVLLLTNDGDLTHKLTHPSSKCPKIYLIKVSGIPTGQSLQKLERGITVEGIRYGRCEIELLGTDSNSWLKVTLTEGKNHQVKNMFAAIGHPVSKLKRVAFGALTVEDMEPGEYRALTELELEKLMSGNYHLPRFMTFQTTIKRYGIPIKPAAKPFARRSFDSKRSLPRGHRPGGDRGRRFDRDDRRPRRDDGEGSERRSYRDRGDSPRFDRERRPYRDGDSESRPRRTFRDREDRPGFDRRPRRDNSEGEQRSRRRFDDRDERRFDRDRPPQGDRLRRNDSDDRRPPRDRDDRPRYDRDRRPPRDRDDRPRYDRDRRPPRDRDDRPRYDRDRRPPRDGDDRPRYDRDRRPKRDDDRSRRDGEDRPRYDRDRKPRKSGEKGSDRRRSTTSERSDRPSSRRNDKSGFRPKSSNNRSFKSRRGPQKSKGFKGNKR